MNSVKKVLTKRLPRYNLRSRKINVSIDKSSTPKVDREIQVDLSDEEREALFAELPYCFQISQDTDIEIQARSNPSPREIPPRSSTALTMPEQANVTDREPQWSPRFSHESR